MMKAILGAANRDQFSSASIDPSRFCVIVTGSLCNSTDAGIPTRRSESRCRRPTSCSGLRTGAPLGACRALRMRKRNANSTVFNKYLI
ncbi:hypothetical protein PAHAL_9G285600 [Panicum hallii]|uniref:Uncharacterized protein n=1 Tax=Panicum hallii TaxID=206008 RepID=A0A2T8I2T8_9POAL|nr:hypothetical protein PAHAL_9G285600 [Panicum hallii]